MNEVNFMRCFLQALPYHLQYGIAVASFVRVIEYYYRSQSSVFYANLSRRWSVHNNNC